MEIGQCTKYKLSPELTVYIYKICILCIVRSINIRLKFRSQKIAWFTNIINFFLISWSKRPFLCVCVWLGVMVSNSNDSNVDIPIFDFFVFFCFGCLFEWQAHEEKLASYPEDLKWGVKWERERGLKKNLSSSYSSYSPTLHTPDISVPQNWICSKDKNKFSFIFIIFCLIFNFFIDVYYFKILKVSTLLSSCRDVKVKLLFFF